MENKIINIISIIIITISIIVMTIITSYVSKNYTFFNGLEIDMSKWNYDDKNNVYYQLNINYCTKPENREIEKLGIYVPGEYMNGKKNQDNTYTCSINKKGEILGYTSQTAPTVILVDSLEYELQNPPEKYEYNDISEYLEAGYIYVKPGIRGWKKHIENVEKEYAENVIDGIADLKAVVKYLRFNKEKLPGYEGKIFAFGINGGTRCAILGASGDSDLYYSELLNIGAITNDLEGKKVLDSVEGVMCCSPYLNLANVQESYTWNVDQYLNPEFDRELNSNYIKYINNMKFKSEKGTLLLLNNVEKDDYNSGTYYEYILEEVEGALNNFLNNTNFPYTNQNKNITYNTPEEYVKYLNSNQQWIEYDKNNNKIQINTIRDFILNCKYNSKNTVEKINDNECNPLYYLSNKYKGKDSSTVAKYWNIYIEVDKENSILCAEENLKLVLQNNENVKTVKYSNLWGREYSIDEKQELIIENLKAWITDCYK